MNSAGGEPVGIASILGKGVGDWQGISHIPTALGNTYGLPGRALSA
ncbi:MAG TPA: hypothetical protein VHT73_08910 [Thermodesulfobacteriota bacterium]|nr:hypothetical protein [Thermodesulfobacteriota bacterium]